MGTIVNPYVSGGGGDQIIFDLVDDFGGSLIDWNTYQKNDAPFAPTEVILTIPAGSYGGYDTSRLSEPYPEQTYGTPLEHIPDDEFKRFRLVGAGAELVTLTVGASFGFGGCPNLRVMPRILPALAGATQVVLENPLGETVPENPGFEPFADLFYVGGWVTVMCLDVQGFGYPPNNQFFDICKVTAFNSVTGEIDLDRPLSYDYVDHYPLWTPGTTGSNSDCGGPATIMPMTRGWCQDVRVSGITIGNSGGQFFFGNARSALFENCSFPGFAPLPSQTLSWIYRNCQFPNSITLEVDKAIEYLEFDNCTIEREIRNYSGGGGAKETLYKDCTFTGGGTVSCCLNTTFQNTTIDQVIVSCLANGATESITAIDSDIAGMFFYSNKYAPIEQATVQTINTNGNGVMNVPRAEYSGGLNPMTALFVPDSVYFFSDDGGGQAIIGPAFRVLDIIDNGATIDVHTNLSGATAVNADIDRIQHAHPNMFDFTNCTGSLCSVSFSNTDASVRPWSYFTTGVVTGHSLPVTDIPQFTGTWVRCKTTVFTPYTGVQSKLQLWPFGYPFFGATFYPGYPPGAGHIIGTTNMKLAGTLSYNATDITTTGSQVAIDSVMPASPLWLTSWTKPALKFVNPDTFSVVDISSEDSSVWPVWTWELFLDHDV